MPDPATQDIYLALGWDSIARKFWHALTLNPVVGEGGFIGIVIWAAGCREPIARIALPEGARRVGGRIWIGDGPDAVKLRAREALELAIRGEGGFTLAGTAGRPAAPATIDPAETPDEWGF